MLNLTHPRGALALASHTAPEGHSTQCKRRFPTPHLVETTTGIRQMRPPAVSIGEPRPLMSLDVDNETTMKSFRSAISDVKIHFAGDDSTIYTPPRQLETSEHLKEALVSNHSISDASTALLFNDELQTADYSERSKPSPLSAANLKMDTADCFMLSYSHYFRYCRPTIAVRAIAHP